MSPDSHDLAVDADHTCRHVQLKQRLENDFGKVWNDPGLPQLTDSSIPPDLHSTTRCNASYKTAKILEGVLLETGG